jgi:glycosyltransferase involved in cell wall biosynthesis
VVSARLPTLAEHFADHEVGFFAPGDARSLAAALLDVARHRDRAAARARAARDRYEEYRWPVNAERYARLLGRLAGTA